jgi:predicted nucleotidyltransferase
MTQKEILQYLSRHKDEFRRDFTVTQIGLFGSFARDEANETSDIDLFVTMEPKLFKLIGLKEKIEADLRRPVDLIRDHRHLRPVLREMIQKDILYV